jgi:hypothetical protein
MKSKILRYATTLHNACMKYYKESRCKGCPFTTDIGCNLYGHPIEWKEKLKSAKQVLEDK